MNLKNLSVITKIPKLFKDKLKNNKINQIYKKFEKSLNIDENFAVAVSGGSDSLALAFLSKVYSINKNLKSKFFIVDHKLRLNSTSEANSVKKILKKYFINCEILTWTGKKPLKNIQAIARKKRLELLFRKCDSYKIDNILLGHHEDDLVENFFIRLTRGSGLKGLVSLDKKNLIDNKKLFRPLLNQKKDDLIYISKHVFNFYVEDQSNKDTKHQRVRIRKLISELKNEGLSQKKFIKTIQNLKSSDDVVNFYVNENLKKNANFSSSRDYYILKKNFFDNPDEIVFRSMTNLIKIVGKKYHPVRGKKLVRIIDKIEKDKLKRDTLGGCLIKKVNQSIIITKEL